MAPTLTLRSTYKGALFQPCKSAHLSRSRRTRTCLTVCRICKVAVLPGDGIGPEICSVAVDLLRAAGEIEGVDFQFTDALVGGAAIDATGSPLPSETLDICKASDAVLLAAIGGCVITSYAYCIIGECGIQFWQEPCLRHSDVGRRYKWDTLPPEQRPEKGLLNLRAGLGTFANLRPAVVLSHLADASSLKREIVDGVDIMIVRELVGGIYFGQPRVRSCRTGCCPVVKRLLQRSYAHLCVLQGFKTNEKGHKVGYNTMIYSEPEVSCKEPLCYLRLWHL